jgi:hypothetical protein
VEKWDVAFIHTAWCQDSRDNHPYCQTIEKDI